MPIDQAPPMERVVIESGPYPGSIYVRVQRMTDLRGAGRNLEWFTVSGHLHEVRRMMCMPIGDWLRRNTGKARLREHE